MGERTGPGGDRNLDDLFLSALGLAPADRPAFLDTACAGDHDLRTEIEALLRLADERPDLLLPPEIGLIPERLGRYELLNELGRGGMGIVFKARDSRLLRTVALKILPQYLGHDPHNLERFTREAQLLARLSHPNIATLHSLDESDGFHFLTMEFVPGVTLAEILADRRLSPRQTLSLAQQVTGALESAHAMGVCHCDLKPANIMVAPDGKISLLDFGIARAFGQLAAAPSQSDPACGTITLVSGTPGYMAPEQAEGQPVDQRSDMWALGVTLFECLTGDAFTWPKAGEKFRWATALPEQTPKNLGALLRECLVPDPAQRLVTAASAHRRVEAMLHGKSHTKWLLGSGGLIVVAGVAAFLSLRGPAGPLHHMVQPDRNIVTGLNSDGETLWSREFDGAAVCPVVLHPRPLADGPAADLEISGCAVTVRTAGEQGFLEFLDPVDGRTLWRHIPGWHVPVNALGPIYYRWLVTCLWPGQDSAIMLAGIRDGLWYSFGVEAVDLQGRVLQVYHHPGPLAVVELSTKPESELGGIVLYGANSSGRFHAGLVPFPTIHHPGCLVKLVPGNLTGQAFPYSENLPEKRDWPGLPKAKEKAYLLIPLISPNFDSFVDQMAMHDRNSGRQGFTAVTRDGRMVIVDDDLFPLKSVFIRDSPADSLYQAGGASITPFLYLHDGQMQWVDVPVEY